MPDGTAVERYTLGNQRGMEVKILTYGGIVQSVEVPDRHGDRVNVTLGLATLDDYVISGNQPGFGAIIGRYANRIAGGEFSLDGRTYRLARNDEPNSLHGGDRGFDKRVWRAAEVRGDQGVGLRLGYVSPDGEEGYPGTLTAAVTFTVTDCDELRLDYHATTAPGDHATVLNLTNHSYWNLGGEGSGTIYGHRLWLNAACYTPVDANLIPTGEIAPVAGTPLDFSEQLEIGARIRDSHPQLVVAHGYDHNYALNRPSPDDGSLLLAARVHDPGSGRSLEVATTQPGIQFYAGNHLDGTLVGTGGRVHRQSDGLALETQHYPDSPNQPGFPAVVLRPGEAYRTTTVYRFLSG
jgi:aldose 1-epimerase